MLEYECEERFDFLVFLLIYKIILVLIFFGFLIKFNIYDFVVCMYLGDFI